MRFGRLALVLALAALAPSAQWERGRGRVRELGQELLERGCPGVSIAVGVGAELVLAEGFGMADLERGVPVDERTRFRVGSVSKPITAAALARLWEEGRMDLDAPVQTYVPGFPEKPQGTISVRLCAGHLAGIRHYRGDEFLSTRHYADVLGPLAVFQGDPLKSAPGERYLYSTYGWSLVSAAVQGAAGEPFLDVLTELVLEPLRMHSTCPDQRARRIEGRACWYERGADGALRVAPAVDLSNKWAGGGLLSTPSDLVRFGAAHLEAGYLRSETLTLLFTSMRTNAGEKTNYGLGWRLGEDEQGHPIRYHTGSSVGGTTALLLQPRSGVIVALATNLSSAPLSMNDARALLAAFRERP